MHYTFTFSHARTHVVCTRLTIWWAFIKSFCFLILSIFQGNVEFDSEDRDSSHITNTEEQDIISRLLGVSREDLEKALCFRVVAARGEVMEKGHTKEDAYYGRDAFAKVWEQTVTNENMTLKITHWKTIFSNAENWENKFYTGNAEKFSISFDQYDYKDLAFLSNNSWQFHWD